MSQNIHILAKRDDPFARVTKSMLDDPSLSWRAKGILSYLLGKPAGWKLRAKDICNHGKEGERAIWAALKEMREAGYAKLAQDREGNKIKEWVWHVCDEPKFLDCRNEDVGNEDLQNEDLQNEDSSKKEVSKKKESKKEEPIDLFGGRESKRPDEIALGPSGLQEAWNDFAAARRGMRKPLTKQAVKMLLAKLKSWPVNEAIEALLTSIECGWSGVFKPTFSRRENNQPQPKPLPSAADARKARQ